MFLFVKARRMRLFYKVFSCVLSVVFAWSTISPTIAMAQSVGVAAFSGVSALNLPIPGAMVTTSPAFVPVLLKGMTIHPENPLKFDFILDSGNTVLSQTEIRKESERLVKYFLAAMTVPKDDLWVNLSPYEEDRIIPDDLGKTELGRDLLAQDYLLKQLTASLMYPEDELGKEFWNRVYEKAREQFGTTDIPIDTFNKVWILPQSATVYENEQTVYVVESKLKVMLDSDYQAEMHDTSSGGKHRDVPLQYDAREIGESIIREIIIPEIEKEVNQGRNFAPLRQIYHSLILAKWYKETIKNSLLSQVYVDQNKTAGVELNNTGYKDEIYQKYIEAYKKGVFDLIKEDYDELSQEVIPRKYFSGGIIDADTKLKTTDSARLVRDSVVGRNFKVVMMVTPQKDGAAVEADSAVPGGPWTLNGAMEMANRGGDYSPAQRLRIISILTRNIQHLEEQKKSLFLAAEEALPLALEMRKAELLGILRKVESNDSSDPAMLGEGIPAVFADSAQNVIEMLARGKNGNIVDNRNVFEKMTQFVVENPEILGLAVGVTLTVVVLRAAGVIGGRLLSQNTIAGNINIIRREDFNFDGQKRAKALDFLVKNGSIEAVKGLLILLKDGVAADQVLKALVEIGDKRAYKPMLAELDKPSVPWVSEIFESLISLNPEAADEIHNKTAKTFLSEIVRLDKDGKHRSKQDMKKALIKLVKDNDVVLDSVKEELSNRNEQIQIAAADIIETAGKDREELVEPSEHSDPAMLGNDNVGGIDMNDINVDRQGSGVDIQFSQEAIQPIIDMGIDGFAPVIINITPINSLLPLLGLVIEEEEQKIKLSLLWPADKVS